MNGAPVGGGKLPSGQGRLSVELAPTAKVIDEVRAACSSVVGDVGAAGLKDMGRCMAALKEKYAGQMDFTKASALVKAALV